MFTALIGPIASLAGSFLENKVEQSKAKGAVLRLRLRRRLKFLSVLLHR